MVGGFERQYVPTLSGADDEERNGLIGAGIKSGAGYIASTFGTSLEGIGLGLGSRGLAEFGADVEQAALDYSDANARSDLEVAPWREGGADVAPWLVYQASKQVPQLGLSILAGRALPSTRGTVAARAGAQAPRVLGGGGLKPGMSFAERRAALRAGDDFARTAIGAEAVGMPIAYGSMYQEAKSQEGGARPGDALMAAALSPVYASLDAIQPAQLQGLMKRGLAGNVVKRVGTAAAVGAASEIPQEGIQTAMELSFRPDLTANEKFSHIVDAAITGGAVGGFFAGTSGVRASRAVEPTSLKDDDLASIVDEQLEPRLLPQGSSSIPAEGTTINVSPRGVEEVTNVNESYLAPQELDDLSRPLRNTTTEELQAGLAAVERAAKNDNITDAMVRFSEEAMQELALREDEASNQSLSEDELLSNEAEVETPDRMRQRGGEDQAATPSAERGRTSPGSLTGGVSNQWVEPLEAANDAGPDKAPTKKSTSNKKVAAKSRSRTAQAEEAASVETPAPAAPAIQEGGDQSVATKFSKSKTWKKEVLKSRPREAKDVQALNPVDRQDAERKVYEALGDQDYSDAMERMAVQLGVLDEDLNLTGKGIAIAEQDPITFERTMEGARQEGYTGAAAAAFERGVQAHLGNDVGFTADTEAFNAGKEWAAKENLVPTVTNNAAYGQASRTQALVNRPFAVAGKDPVITPEQERQQRISSLMGPDNQRNLAYLRQMAEKGATAEEIDAAIKRAESGEQLFQEPDRAPNEPFVGERPDGISLSVQQKAAGEALGTGKVSGRDRALRRKAQNRSPFKRAADLRESRRAIKAHGLQVAAREALARGEFTQLDFIKTTALIKNGHFDMAEKMLSEDGDPLIKEQAKVSRREFLAGITAAAAVAAVPAPAKATINFVTASNNVVKAIKLGNTKGALEEIARTSKSGMYRMLARKMLAAGGWEDIRMQYVDWDATARGTSEVDDNGVPFITIYGKEGLNEQTFMHEAIHAYVQYRWAGLGVFNRNNRDLLNWTDERGVQEIEEFRKLWGTVGIALKRMGLVETEVWAQQFYYDPDEAISWALTNPDAQALLRTIDVNGAIVRGEKRSIFTKLVDAIYKLFGGSGGGAFRSALDDILDASNSIVNAGAVTPTGEYSKRFMKKLRADQASLKNLEGSNLIKSQMKGPAASGVESAGNVKEAAGKAINAAKNVPFREMWEKTGKAALGWMSIHHLVRQFGRLLPSIADYERANYLRTVTQSTWAKMYQVPYNAIAKMERTAPKTFRKINELMAMTQFSIDPSKDWSKHEHLHGAWNAAALRQRVKDANAMYRDLQRSGDIQTYEALKAINESNHTALMSTALYNLINAEQADIAGSNIDPNAKFREDARLHEDPIASRKYWRDTLEAQLSSVDQYVSQMEAAGDGLRAESIATHAAHIRQTLGAMDQAPYFHLGRHGEYAVAFNVRGENGRPDRAAMNHVSQFLAANGFKDINIDPDAPTARIRIHSETKDAMEQLAKLASQLRDEGWIEQDEFFAGKRSDAALSRGFGANNTDMINRLTEAIEASPVFDTEGATPATKARIEQEKKQTLEAIRGLWLDLLPDISLNKVMVQRRNIAGFGNDMTRNFAHRFEVGVTALANLSSAPAVSKSFADMQAKISEYEATDPDKAVRARDVHDEVRLREILRPQRIQRKWLQNTLAFNHAYFLGFSPSYVAVNTTQLGVLLWPELAKKHSYVKSARAIAKVTPMAFKIMSTALKAGFDVSASRAADAVITEKVLKDAGVPPATAKFMMKMISSGIIDIGGAARELARVADGSIDSKKDQFLRYASSFGLYSETFTRTVAALAARDLHGPGDGVNEYAQSVVAESMLNYATWNTSRQMSENGIFGPVGRLGFSFLQYSAQVLEKMYSEVHTAFMDKAKTPAEKEAAKRFLKGHLAAVGMLAGSLGLPFATVVASVIERAHDLFDDDETPYDATAAWRNFLADVFGEDMGEVAARGLPRVLNFDLSQRAGEQDMLPFSDFFIDRRDWDDKVSELTYRSAGAPLSMAVNIAKGGEKMMEGDILAGMKEMVPLALKGPVEGYRMTQDGYQDTRGNKLPMEAGATDILVQLLGFTPAEKAEYSESKRDQQMRKGILTKEAAKLRNGIRDAVLAGDNDEARELIAKAQKFDADNPEYAVLPNVGSAIKSAVEAQAVAGAIESPVGVRPEDLPARSLTGYANIDYQPSIR